MITDYWNGTYSSFTQDNVVTRILAAMVRKQVNESFRKGTGESVDELRKQLFEKGWLDVEPIFKKAGWDVEYDKPGYNESYPATFKFSRKKK